MPFRPLNTNHAIESAAFAIKFVRPFTQAEWQAINDNYQEWLNILPAVHFDSGKNLGAFFSFFQPDGTFSWQMAMQKSHIVVICNQYTRWKNVKEQVLKLFQLISEVLLKDGTSKLVVHSIAFEMNDIFIHDGQDDYKLDELFIKDNSRLLDSLFESGQYWHQDTGSLIESSPNEEHFEKISLKSSKRDETIAIHLTHYQEIYFDNDAILKSFVESDAQKLSSDLETMHKGNKALLQEILTKEMQEEIALNAEVG